MDGGTIKVISSHLTDIAVKAEDGEVWLDFEKGGEHVAFVHFSPEKARELALAIIEAADAITSAHQ